MTEDEAKTKACCGAPGLMMVALMQMPGTAVSEPERIGKCLGADCMAFRSPHPHNCFCGLAGAAQ